MTKPRQKNLFAGKHGAATRTAKTRTYKTWSGMIARCHIESASGFPQYGGKGVLVCDRWRNSFTAFLDDMGEAPDGCSLDRKDSAGNYEPSNCRWATRQEQNENRRNVIWHEFNGKRLTVTGWARELGLSQATMQLRLKRWTVERALSTPKVH